MPSSSHSQLIRIATMSDDESAPQKMHSGYHGWMKSIPKTDQDFTPARIDAPVAAAAPANGGSAWNAGGTWEERDKSEWARERLKHHILSSFAFTDDARSLSVKATSIVRCEGDAKIVFSRGKKRCGYDMSVKFEYESTRLGEDDEGFPEATGFVELHDFDDTSGEEYEVSVKPEGTSQHAKDAQKAVQEWESGLRKLLATWKDELLQQ